MKNPDLQDETYLIEDLKFAEYSLREAIIEGGKNNEIMDKIEDFLDTKNIKGLKSLIEGTYTSYKTIIQIYIDAYKKAQPYLKKEKITEIQPKEIKNISGKTHDKTMILQA